MDRPRGLRLCAAALAAALSIAAGPPAPDDPAAISGAWDLSRDGADRKCRLTFWPEPAATGQTLRFPAGCRRALPVLAGAAAWHVPGARRPAPSWARRRDPPRVPPRRRRRLHGEDRRGRRGLPAQARRADPARAPAAAAAADRRPAGDGDRPGEGAAAGKPARHLRGRPLHRARSLPRPPRREPAGRARPLRGAPRRGLPRRRASAAFVRRRGATTAAASP